MAKDATAFGQLVASGEKTLLALSVVVAVAVLREGAEVVLFLYGIAASSTEGPVAMLTGSLLGIGFGALTSFVLYRGLVAISVRHFFAVTYGMIALLAAGMAGQAASLLANDGFIPTWGDQLWDSSWLLSDGSLAGKALHALVGYADHPSGIQIAIWACTLAILILIARLVKVRRHPAQESRVNSSARGLPAAKLKG